MTLAEMYLREARRMRDAFMDHIIGAEHRDVCRGSCLVIDVYAAGFCRLKDAAVLPSPDPRMYRDEPDDETTTAAVAAKGATT